MDTVTRVQILVNSRETRVFSLGEAASLGEGKLWFQTCETLLKIDLMSYPARAEVLVNMDMYKQNRVLNNLQGFICYKTQPVNDVNLKENEKLNIWKYEVLFGFLFFFFGFFLTAVASKVRPGKFISQRVTR